MTDSVQYSRVAAQLYRNAPFAFRVTQRLRPFICPFRELIASVPDASNILDVGCGAGLFIALLATAGKINSARGVDPSHTAISVAGEMMTRLPKSSTISFARVASEDTWSSSDFDVVAMIDVMHHVPKDAQAAFFAQAVDRVAPGGLLVYKDIAERPFWRATANRVHDLLLARQWIHYVPLSSVKQWASRSGLILEDFQTLNMLWYSHELLVLRKPAASGTEEV
jgi:2-polyprenyl-3-methyl-5-hydroxy-6-metoxy-1,4-benzoquinol methylase